MKSYTDIEQSKKLAEILPVESADMCWGINDDTLKYNQRPYLGAYIQYSAKEFYLPCWSLAALFEALPHSLDDRYTLQLGYPPGDGDWYIMCVDTSGFIKSPAVVHSNLIDACVEMIVKLKEKDLL